MARGSSQDEQVGEHVDDVDCLEPAADPDGQALPGVFVDHIEHAELSAIVGSALDEVVGPDMVGVLGPQPDAGSVMEPEPPAFGLLLWNLEPLSSPDPFHPLVVHHPTDPMQHRRDPTIAIPAILSGKFDDVSCQSRFIFTGLESFALGRSVLPQNPAGATLRDAKQSNNMIHASTAASRA